MGYPCKEYFHPMKSNIEMIFYCVLTSLVIIPAIIENVVVIYTIISKPRLHTPAYCLNAALAISDLSIVFVGGTSYVLIITLGGSRHCLLKTFFAFVHGTVSMTTALLLVVITRDRYLSFKNITSRTQHATVNKNIVLALACLFASMMLASTLFIELKYSAFSGRELFSTLFFSAFIVIAVYYQKLRTSIKSRAQPLLVRQDTFMSSYHADTSQNSQERNRQSRRFASVNASIIMLVGSFAIAYLPFALLFTVHTVNQRIFNEVDPRVSHAFVWANSFGYLNAVLDPLVYAFRCDPIGKELRKIVYRVKRSVFPAKVGPGSDSF